MTFARRIAIGAIAASLVPLLFAALLLANLKEGIRKRQQLVPAQQLGFCWLVFNEGPPARGRT